MAFDVENIFSELQNLSVDINKKEKLKESREKLLVILENINQVPESYHALIQDLLNKLGYYPYLSKFSDKSFKNSINEEFHRSSVLNDFVLHRDQFLISEKLNEQKSVILSAPTSFGKTLLVEEVVARRMYKNIAIIEPTLALIDEIRNKLKQYTDFYKIIFSKNQKPAESNIFLLTQERLIEYPNLPDINFFVIDEFYKLDLDTDERSDTLNHAFYLLLKKTKNFYLLGPPIKSIPTNFIQKYDCELKITDFETVKINFVNAGKRSAQNLYKLLDGFSDQTLIYCSGPGTAESNAKKFLDKSTSLNSEDGNSDIIEWISEHLHEDWSLVELLKSGIGFHHGGLPRHISRYLVEAFNKKTIKYLFCTSTLIEGVNTSAKNIVVYDNKKGRKLLTKFDLRNIAGRAGRMSQYLSGNVYMFIGDPEEDSEHVDFPWFSQDSASDSLLVQIDPEDLNPDPAEKVKKIRDNDQLDFGVIKKNSNVDPTGQIALAKLLREDTSLNNYLAWTSHPTYSQLNKSCELIWEYLVRRAEGQRMVDGVVSASQLTFITNVYRNKKLPSLLLKDYLIRKPEENVDKAISTVMGWVRKWFEFRMPKMLMTLHNIQEKIYSELGLPIGNYKYFAAELEHGFLPPSISTLREMGIPAELGKKIIASINFHKDMTIDDILENTDKIDLKKFSNYEQNLIKKL